MSALTLLTPRARDLGAGFTVRRVLPAAQRRAVGPFVFFDHFGPLTAGPDDDHDVRPHPHIGLATVTYLFEGALMHRDSTGVVQRIEPGAVNWMTAGAGIVHSERIPADLRQVERRSHGLQLWAALPEAFEEVPAAFSHTPAEAVPELASDGVVIRLLVGRAFGLVSPVSTLSPALYADVQLSPGASLVLPAGRAEIGRECAVYSVSGTAAANGQLLAPQSMAVLAPGGSATLSSAEGARLMLIGGEPLGHRHMWWNFVSSRKERIVQAADDWAAQRFAPVPGETDFIPLPERRP
jgi:redox-sensitive bicupin YhaK (pirin superfamily)